jgi:hypothetical protein
MVVSSNLGREVGLVAQRSALIGLVRHSEGLPFWTKAFSTEMIDSEEHNVHRPNQAQAPRDIMTSAPWDAMYTRMSSAVRLMTSAPMDLLNNLEMPRIRVCHPPCQCVRGISRIQVSVHISGSNWQVLVPNRTRSRLISLTRPIVPYRTINAQRSSVKILT